MDYGSRNKKKERGGRGGAERNDQANAELRQKNIVNSV